jgi:hypothetical protein
MGAVCSEKFTIPQVPIRTRTHAHASVLAPAIHWEVFPEEQVPCHSALRYYAARNSR